MALGASLYSVMESMFLCLKCGAPVHSAVLVRRNGVKKLAVFCHGEATFLDVPVDLKVSSDIFYVFADRENNSTSKENKLVHNG